jgi:hypothetical protein
MSLEDTQTLRAIRSIFLASMKAPAIFFAQSLLAVLSDFPAVDLRQFQALLLQRKRALQFLYLRSQ